MRCPDCGHENAAERLRCEACDTVLLDGGGQTLQQIPQGGLQGGSPPPAAEAPSQDEPGTGDDDPPTADEAPASSDSEATADGASDAADPPDAPAGTDFGPTHEQLQPVLPPTPRADPTRPSAQDGSATAASSATPETPDTEAARATSPPDADYGPTHEQIQPVLSPTPRATDPADAASVRPGGGETAPTNAGASDGAPADAAPTPSPGSGPADTPPPADAPGKNALVGGRYEVLENLGAGGQGNVVLAMDTSMERQVAIKRLTQLDAATLERFRSEARSIAALSHPNICNVFDFIDDASDPMMVMEYIEGGTLGARVVEDGPLKGKLLLGVARGVARALGSAHRKGVIHRDVKPANILLDHHDSPRLIDFGLGKKGDSSALTQSGTGMGTLDYVSPEQLADATRADARSDIYSYGLTLYHASTGESPRLMRESRIPEAWKDLILRCIEQDPAERPQDMGEVEKALDAIETALADPKAGRGHVPVENTATDGGPDGIRWGRVAALIVVLALVGWAALQFLGGSGDGGGDGGAAPDVDTPTPVAPDAEAAAAGDAPDWYGPPVTTRIGLGIYFTFPVPVDATDGDVDTRRDLARKTAELVASTPITEAALGGLRVALQDHERQIGWDAEQAAGELTIWARVLASDLVRRGEEVDYVEVGDTAFLRFAVSLPDFVDAVAGRVEEALGRDELPLSPGADPTSLRTDARAALEALAASGPAAIDTRLAAARERPWSGAPTEPSSDLDGQGATSPATAAAAPPWADQQGLFEVDGILAWVGTGQADAADAEAVHRAEQHAWDTARELAEVRQDDMGKAFVLMHWHELGIDEDSGRHIAGLAGNSLALSDYRNDRAADHVAGDTAYTRTRVPVRVAARVGLRAVSSSFMRGAVADVEQLDGEDPFTAINDFVKEVSALDADRLTAFLDAAHEAPWPSAGERSGLDVPWRETETTTPPAWLGQPPQLVTIDGVLMAQASATTTVNTPATREQQALALARSELGDIVARLTERVALGSLQYVRMKGDPRDTDAFDDFARSVIRETTAEVLPEAAIAERFVHPDGRLSVLAQLPASVVLAPITDRLEDDQRELFVLLTGEADPDVSDIRYRLGLQPFAPILTAALGGLAEGRYELRAEEEPQTPWVDSTPLEELRARLQSNEEGAALGFRTWATWNGVEYTTTNLPVGRPLPDGGYRLAVGDSAGIDFILIPGGTFTMGTPIGERGRHDREGPQRDVTLPPFLIAKHEVTQGQYAVVTGERPSRFAEAGDDAPVDSVSWHDAVAFCERLGLALPSEAQWEYAARAGATTGFPHAPVSDEGANASQALDTVAWYAGNCGVLYDGGHDTSGWGQKQLPHTRGGTHPVGQKQPNAWGLHDVLGNVAEWCADTWHDDLTGLPRDGRPAEGGLEPWRPVRGASWMAQPLGMRLGARQRIDATLDEVKPEHRARYGFRPIIPLLRDDG